MVSGPPARGVLTGLFSFTGSNGLRGIHFFLTVSRTPRPVSDGPHSWPILNERMIAKKKNCQGGVAEKNKKWP